MSRCYGFQQQKSSYAMHKESRQQQSYSIHSEARNYSNNRDLQNHVTAMQIVPSLGIIDHHSQSQALRHQSKLRDTGLEYGFGGGKSTLMTFPDSGFNGSPSAHFSNFGCSSLGNAEFGALEEVFGPAVGMVRRQEVRYERSSWGGGGGGSGSASFGGLFDDGGSWNGYSRVEWISKGI